MIFTFTETTDSLRKKILNKALLDENLRKYGFTKPARSREAIVRTAIYEIVFQGVEISEQLSYIFVEHALALILRESIFNGKSNRLNNRHVLKESLRIALQVRLNFEEYFRGNLYPEALSFNICLFPFVQEIFDVKQVLSPRELAWIFKYIPSCGEPDSEKMQKLILLALTSIFSFGRMDSIGKDDLYFILDSLVFFLPWSENFLNENKHQSLNSFLALAPHAPERFIEGPGWNDFRGQGINYYALLCLYGRAVSDEIEDLEIHTLANIYGVQYH